MSETLSAGAVRMLRKVKRHILAEPKRISMGFWCLTGDDVTINSLKASPCGTVGCIGGWLETLYAAEHRKTKTAFQILDMLSDFNGPAYNFFYDTRLMAQKPQTAAHARAVAKHIDKFIAEHRPQPKRRTRRRAK